VGAVIVGLYALFAFVALTNWLLIRRPRRGTAGGPTLCVLIPARNEADNLRELLPQLVPQGAKVYVFDDESDDGTGDVAASLGATAIRPREPLPAGWTGKNRACHELAKAASEDSDADWMLFLDADVRVTPDFVAGVRDLLARTGGVCGVLTGFPNVIPGRGIEPLFLGWVGWILLCTNPFGIVSRTRMGHSGFTNGQFHAWRRDVYTRLWPNEAVRHHVLEDVMMGRLCAREKVRVEVANVSRILSVRMYETWRQTLDGMSKNSYEITGSAAGSYGLGFLLLTIGWLWVLVPWAFPLFVLSGVFCALTVRGRATGMLLLPFTLPLALTIGAYTLARSVAWRKRGTVVWKGRTYPGG